MLSAICFNLDKSKILSFGIELNEFQITSVIHVFSSSSHGVVYSINEVDGTLEPTHKLQVSSKNFPGLFGQFISFKLDCFRRKP